MLETITMQNQKAPDIIGHINYKAAPDCKGIMF